MKSMLMVLLSVFFSLLGNNQVQAQGNKSLKGNGNIMKEYRDLPAYSGVEVGGAFDVFIRKGNSDKAEIEADENLMPHIKMTVKNKILHISMDGQVQKVSKLNVVLTMNELNYLSASGASDIKGEDKFSTDKFELNASGASDVEVNINTEMLKCTVSGSSDLQLQGETNELDLNLSGASEFDGADFRARSVSIQASGSSSAHVYASDALRVSASGASDIHCDGSPSKKEVHTSGSADVDVE